MPCVIDFSLICDSLTVAKFVEICMTLFESLMVSKYVEICRLYLVESYCVVVDCLEMVCDLRLIYLDSHSTHAHQLLGGVCCGIFIGAPLMYDAFIFVADPSFTGLGSSCAETLLLIIIYLSFKKYDNSYFATTLLLFILLISWNKLLFIKNNFYLIIKHILTLL
jgi:hypothetical protein